MDALLEKDIVLDGATALAAIESEVRAASSSVLPARFGAAVSAEVYAKAKQLVIDYKILRLYQKLNLRPGYVSVVICNTWRIDRALDSARVELFDRDFVNGQWISSETLGNWPWINLLPITLRYSDNSDPSESAWKEVLTKAFYRVLDAAGLDRLNDLPIANGEESTEAPLPKGLVVKVFMDFYLMPSASKPRRRKVARRTTLKLEPSRFAQAFRALRKNLWIEIIDREVLRVVAAVEGFKNRVLLTDYLRSARYAGDLLRIARETRNLLPLLTRIRPEQWFRQDLFSRRLWVRDERKSTVVDRPLFSERIELRNQLINGRFRTGTLRLRSFTSPAAHRWLMRAPSSVVSAWRLRMNPVTAENFAAANLPKRVPALVLCMLITTPQIGSNEVVSAQYQRLYRLFSVHACDVVKAMGWARFRADYSMHRRDLLEIFDWLRADGFARGLPDKNATWASMTRQCNEWHQRLREEREALEDARRSQKWESYLESAEIDGYTVRALTNAVELTKEGREMHHCVGSYADDCWEGYYRVFSVVSPTGERSTVGLECHSKFRWVVQQMYGVCNAVLPSETLDIGKKVANLYSKLARERAVNE